MPSEITLLAAGFAVHQGRMPLLVVVGLMPLARTFVSLPAGHARVPVARFAVLTTLGCAIWAAGFVLAGMLLGASWEHAGHALRIPLRLLGAATAVAILLRARSRKRRNQDPVADASPANERDR